jgi:hypothetical protein
VNSTGSEPTADKASGPASSSTILYEEVQELLWQGLRTGKIETPWITVDWTHSSCLENCRDFGAIGSVHQIGCPNIPNRE